MNSIVKCGFVFNSLIYQLLIIKNLFNTNINIIHFCFLFMIHIRRRVFWISINFDDVFFAFQNFYSGPFSLKLWHFLIHLIFWETSGSAINKINVLSIDCFIGKFEKYDHNIQFNIFWVFERKICFYHIIFKHLLNILIVF